MADTTYAVISQRTTAYAAVEALKHAEPILVLDKLAQVKPVPRNKASNVTFRRPNVFAVDGVAIAEGVNPTPEALTYTDVNVPLSTYGHVTKITEEVSDQSEDPVLKDASMLTGEWGAETKEQILWAALIGGTSVTYAAGVASRILVNTAVALADVRVAVRALRSARAKRITRILAASVNIATQPVEAAFVAVCHTDLDGDIRNLAGFTPVSQYGSMKPICAEELGSVENVRFVTTPLLEPTATMRTNAGGTVGTGFISSAGTGDVYPIMILGQEAFGSVPLKGKGAISMKVVQAGTASAADPLGRFGYIGGSMVCAAKILNEAWLNRIECYATA